MESKQIIEIIIITAVSSIITVMFSEKYIWGVVLALIMYSMIKNGD